LEKDLKQMKKPDVKCLIRNFRYAVKQNRNEDCEVFAHLMRAALEHHFNEHECCNPKWCQFRVDSVQNTDDLKGCKANKTQTTKSCMRL